MYLIREIMYCKPGKARPMVEKMKALSHLNKELGFSEMRVMTDVSAERYWTVVSETIVDNLDEHAKRSQQAMQMPAFQEAMKGYHDLVDHGRREIYTVEK